MYPIREHVNRLGTVEGIGGGEAEVSGVLLLLGFYFVGVFGKEVVMQYDRDTKQYPGIDGALVEQFVDIGSTV